MGLLFRPRTVEESRMLESDLQGCGIYLPSLQPLTCVFFLVWGIRVFGFVFVFNVLGFRV